MVILPIPEQFRNIGERKIIMDIDKLIKALQDAKKDAPQGGLTEAVIFVNDYTPLRIVHVGIEKNDESLAVECNGAYCAIDTCSW